MSIVPVHMGSPRFTELEVPGFRITDAWFPPGEVLPYHTHERTIFAVMLDGSFVDHFRRGAYDCGPSTVFTEPAGEPHENRIERAGARVLVVQPDPSREGLLRPVRRALEGIHHFRHGEIARLARCVGDEIRRSDASAAPAAESRVLEMLAVAAGVEPDRDMGAVPGWLERAREVIHATYQDAPTVEGIADQVGVHRVHLARSFRHHYHVPVGIYIRRLRLEWSATRLVEADEAISSIALRAGFADQSHFTRSFKSHLGLPPGEYRRQHGGGRRGLPGSVAQITFRQSVTKLQDEPPGDP